MTEVDAAPPPVLLVTALAELEAELRRLAGAVGVGLDARPDLETAGRDWLRAPVVLLGEDAAGRGTPVRRPGVVLVAPADAGQRVWQRAVEAGAEAVAVLPRDDEWLLERLAAAADGPPRASRLVGVIGGCGGAGASSLAVALALRAARRREVLLVDADPFGAGIDLLAGVEDATGLRWGDLLHARGVLRAGVLRQGLPTLGRLRLLTWGRHDPIDVPVTGVEAVLDAAGRSHDLVVVDLPRRDDPATAAVLWRLDTLLVVVPATVPAAAAASRLVTRLAPHVADLRLVVRGPAPGGLSAAAVADALELPLAAVCAAERRLASATDRGEPPGSRSRGPLARLSADLVDLLAIGQPA
jgi:secretion/DNA translocation related CpaE-like protein